MSAVTFALIAAMGLCGGDKCAADAAHKGCCAKQTSKAAGTNAVQDHRTGVSEPKPWWTVKRIAYQKPPVADQTMVDDDDQPDAFVQSARSAGAIQPGGPWLGVQFGPVSKPLAAHLGLKPGNGQMILNVVEGSPADTAGLQQYDVISQIDNRPVSNDMEEFIDTLRGFAPGETRALSVFRGGKETQTNLVIGARPEDLGAQKYKYEMEPEELSQTQMFNRGTMFQRDPSGNWMFKGDLDLNNLPDMMKNFNFNFQVPDAGQNLSLEKSVGGKSIKIERKNGGDITVTTTETKDGNTTTTTKTYANEDELKNNDPDAYKMLKGSVRFGFLNKDGNLWMQQGIPFDPKMFHVDPKDWNVDTDKMMREHQEAMEKLQEQLQSQGKGMQDVFITRPRTSFEVQADGSIKATVRQGDRELVENFSSADELKTKRPDLYRKFEKLQSGNRTPSGR